MRTSLLLGGLLAAVLASPPVSAQTPNIGGQYECSVTHTTVTGRLTLTCTPEGDAPENPSGTWEASGSNSDIVQIPDSVYLFRIEADATHADGGSENFAVWCGLDSASQRGGLLVNEIIGPRRNVTSWSSTHVNERDYNGRGQPCRQLTIKYALGVSWTLTQVSTRSSQRTTFHYTGRGNSSSEQADILSVLEKRAERERIRN